MIQVGCSVHNALWCEIVIQLQLIFGVFRESLIIFRVNHATSICLFWKQYNIYLSQQQGELFRQPVICIFLSLNSNIFQIEQVPRKFRNDYHALLLQVWILQSYMANSYQRHGCSPAAMLRVPWKCQQKLQRQEMWRRNSSMAP